VNKKRKEKEEIGSIMITALIRENNQVGCPISSLYGDHLYFVSMILGRGGTSAEQISVSWSNFTISGEKSKKVQHLKIALFLVIQ
jgi:hypothetical protein